MEVITPHGKYKEHPRARGENLETYAYQVLPEGTSPRTRGKRP